MTTQTLGEDRRIVTCDGCGTPYTAVIDRGEVRLVGPPASECPNCGGVTFSLLTL